MKKSIWFCESGKISREFGFGLRILVSILMGFVSNSGVCAQKSNPVFSIFSGDAKIEFNREQLLQMKSVREITVHHDPGYKKEMRYLAVPIAELLSRVSMSETTFVNYFCLDGFSGPLSQKPLLNFSPEGPIGYLAIETANAPWDLLPGKSVSAGPFYLVWVNSEGSEITQEQWPHQLASFQLVNSFEKQYSKLTPHSEDPTVLLGYKNFVKYCFGCHTLNGQGTSRLGPDLNVPSSPVEYFKKEYLRQLIRNPQTVRTWPNARMQGFESSVLSDPDLESIITYLGHMASRRK